MNANFQHNTQVGTVSNLFFCRVPHRFKDAAQSGLPWGGLAEEQRDACGTHFTRCTEHRSARKRLHHAAPSLSPPASVPCSNPTRVSHPNLSQGQGPGPHNLFSSAIIFVCSLLSALHTLSCWPRRTCPPQRPDSCSSLPGTFFPAQTEGHPFTSFRSPLPSVMVSVAFPNHRYGVAAPASHAPRPSSLPGFSLSTQSDMPHLFLLRLLQVWPALGTVSPVSADINVRVERSAEDDAWHGAGQRRTRAERPKEQLCPEVLIHATCSRMQDRTVARNF